MIKTNINILTLDIEDYYCHDNYSQMFDWEKYPVRIYEPLYKILDLLDEYQVKATCFCLGWLAEKHPDIIKEITQRGHEIACHSYQHQLAYRFNRETFLQDTLKAKKLLEDLSGKEVVSYRAPSFSFTDKNTYAFDVLIELGFKYDCSVFPKKRECGGLKSYGSAEPKIFKSEKGIIKEFPTNLFSVLGQTVTFSGGGYFRVLPYYATKYMTKHSKYVMSYFHPSDFDVNQPNITSLPLLRQIKNRIGLYGAFKKFRKYIHDFDFVTIQEADRLINWDKTKTILI